jgi:hypothetical protein
MATLTIHTLSYLPTQKCAWGGNRVFNMIEDRSKLRDVKRG